MHTPTPAVQAKCACGGTCSKCQEEHKEEEEHLQTKRVGANDLYPPQYQR